MESGHVPVRRRDVVDLLRLYGHADPAERDHLLALADQSAGHGWWDHFADTLPVHLRRQLELEAAASLLVTYDSLAVPALLQTREYAQALCDAGSQGGAWRAGLRMVELSHRQDLLRIPEAPRLWALIHESVLHQLSHQPGVMRAQVAHLAEAAQAPHVTIQIVPAGRPEALAAATPFTITRFGQPDLPDRVSVELLTGITSVDRREDIDAYWLLVNVLAAHAADPRQSLAILRNAIGEEAASEQQQQAAAGAGAS
jgi:Domain of unknown function (DUF5753)